jgi:Ring finger domain
VYVGCNPPAGVELKANSLCQECCTNPLAYLNINTEKYDMKLLRARAGLEDKCTRAL